MERRWLIFALASMIVSPLGWPLSARVRQPTPFAQANLRMARARAGQLRRQRISKGQIPPRWMDRLKKMTPGEQERFLENNRRFQSLPPQRQAEIRARLKQWNSLTPEQRQVLIRRARILERMTPQQRREIRQVILPEWRQLPPNRRRLLVRKLQQLQGLSDAQRKQKLEDPQFVRGLSPNERDLLTKLSELKVGPGGG